MPSIVVVLEAWQLASERLNLETGVPVEFTLRWEPRLSNDDSSTLTFVQKSEPESMVPLGASSYRVVATPVEHHEFNGLPCIAAQCLGVRFYLLEQELRGLEPGVKLAGRGSFFLDPGPWRELSYRYRCCDLSMQFRVSRIRRVPIPETEVDRGDVTCHDTWLGEGGYPEESVVEVERPSKDDREAFFLLDLEFPGGSRRPPGSESTPTG
jgi:hypothetical protein